jgi:Protein of unknown function (DUF3592)
MLLLVITACLLVGLGARGAWCQQRGLLSFQPVNASVDRNEVRSSKLGGFEPDVHFSYIVRGKTYESEQAAPLYINGSRDWVESVSRRVQAEGLTAYVNPLNPSDAYLLPIGLFRPYGLILAGLTILGLGLLPIGAGGALAHKPVAITGGPFDWYGLTPGGTHADRALGWSTTAVLWYLLGGMVVGHYYMTVPPNYELKSAVIAVLFAVAGAWPAYRATYAIGIASRLGTPKVQMTRKTAQLDQSIIVRIEQPFLRDTIVREVRVAVTCTRRNGLGSVRYFTASRIAAEDRAFRVGECIHGEFNIEVPDKKRRPSTPFTRWDYPRTDWQIEVTTRTAKSSVTIAFPIVAENTRRAAKAA